MSPSTQHITLTRSLENGHHRTYVFAMSEDASKIVTALQKSRLVDPADLVDVLEGIDGVSRLSLISRNEKGHMHGSCISKDENGNVLSDHTYEGGYKIGLAYNTRHQKPYAWYEDGKSKPVAESNNEQDLYKKVIGYYGSLLNADKTSDMGVALLGTRIVLKQPLEDGGTQISHIKTSPRLIAELLADRHAGNITAEDAFRILEETDEKTHLARLYTLDRNGELFGSDKTWFDDRTLSSHTIWEHGIRVGIAYRAAFEKSAYMWHEGKNESPRITGATHEEVSKKAYDACEEKLQALGMPPNPYPHF